MRQIWCGEHLYPEPRDDGICMFTGCGYVAELPAPWCHTHLERHRQSEELSVLWEVVGRAAYVAEHLMQMIDQDAWRASGGDDGQGHYEGDYRAEQTAREIERWKAEVTR